MQEGDIYIKFDTEVTAERAIAGLNGRFLYVITDVFRGQRSNIVAVEASKSLLNSHQTQSLQLVETENFDSFFLSEQVVFQQVHSRLDKTIQA